MPLAHALEVNALTLDEVEGPRLTAHLVVGACAGAEAEVRDLAERWFRALEALVRHARGSLALAGAALAICRWWRCRRPRSSGWRAQYPQIEDILPLSPLQEGLLFHALYDAQAPDVYTVQLELGLEGPLDSDGAAGGGAGSGGSAMRACARASGMRTSAGRCRSSCRRWRCPGAASICHCWTSAAVRERLAGILAQERAERFDLACAPLLRFTLIRLAADRHRLVLTNHHILMDGWSMPVLVQELLTLYARARAMTAGALPRVTPYRDYLAWIAAQDRDAAIAAWREALAGLDEATRLAAQDAGRAPVGARADHAGAERGADRGADAGRRARQGLTLNTLIQAAWAILLGRLTGRDDVVFGVTVAGRPPEIAGIERMVGLFINTLPLRIKLPPGKPLLALVRGGAGQPVASDGAPASRACRDPGPGRIGRAVRHPGGVRELSGRSRRALRRMPAVCGSAISAGSMPRIIR